MSFEAQEAIDTYINLYFGLFAQFAQQHYTQFSLQLKSTLALFLQQVRCPLLRPGSLQSQQQEHRLPPPGLSSSGRVPVVMTWQ